MGSMRFLFPDDRITDQTAQQAYLSGYDRIPWPIRVRLGEGEMVVERSTDDSGSLSIPWQVEGHGPVTVSTASLMERDEPYRLPLELARGKISHVRNQLSDWQVIGLAVPPEVHRKVAEAMEHFSGAVVADHGSEESSESAEQALRAAVDAAHLLAACYSEQALAVRRRAQQKLPSLLGADLGTSLLEEYTAREFLQSLNAANVPLSWREVETTEENYCWDVSDKQVQWCRAGKLRVSAGPLLNFDEHYLPDWLTLYEDDFESVFSFVSEYVQAVVGRYRGKVDVWQCAGRMNTADVLGLSEEEKVKLTARTIELTRSLDPDTPVVASFDQPWAEYLSRRGMDFPPVHFADALVRADLGLSGLVLEINVGQHPGGSLARDPLEFNRLVDYWSLLGVPLYLALTVPSESHADPLARRKTDLTPESWSPKRQQAWVSRFVPLLLAKPSVHGVFWQQLRDSEPHDYPHAGLFDLRRHPKPALRQLATIRKAYLR